MNQGDLLVDRKRLKQRLALWRALAILILIVALFFGIEHLRGKQTPGGMGRDFIAQITIDGIISDNDDLNKLLADIEKNPRIKAVIVRLDSPGGTAVGGEEIFLRLKKIAAKKPVVGVMRTLCASACYMASLGTDHTVARDSTLTGSIGVLLQGAELSKMAEKLGITPITIKSGRYKDVPSFTEPFSEDDRAVVQQLVTESYDHFVGMIVANRKMEESRVRELADGRVYTGSQAVKLQLVDGIGGQDEAIEWLSKIRKINPKLEVREMKAEPEIDSLLEKLTGYVGVKIFGKSMVGLDGLVSIWHPSLQ
jgi:protease-4